MNYTEIGVFIVYLLAMLSIGIYFYFKERGGSEKTYFLGGRTMGPWVSALSAGASDMSAWVLMGLPTSVYALGMNQIWIPIGLAIGYALSWILEAPRLRRFSIVAGDSITIPQYLTNRFLSRSKSLQVVCAAVFLFAYTIYAASSIKACGTLFNTVTGIDEKLAMQIASAVIISYTFLGGYSAVCWTDFFQGMLILGAMLLAPICGAFVLAGGGSVSAAAEPGYWNAFSDVREIISGLAWGIGYFGMPHIIIRFMSLKSQRELKKSAVIGISWTVLIVIFAVLIGVIGRRMLGFDEEINSGSLVFIVMVRRMFPPLLSGILLSAVLSASMSTADSQLLAASSSFASDVYQSVIRKNRGSSGEMMFVSRVVVIAVSLIAYFIARAPGSGSIMDMVSNAWGVFGAAFGPVIMLSLYWKKLSFSGAVAGIAVGAISDIIWCYTLSFTGIYEILPASILGLLSALIVSKFSRQPSAEVQELFDRAVAYTED